MADDRPASDLYERDFYAWTQLQADALRTHGRGGNALDYDHLALEVGDLGAWEWNKVRSLLLRIIQHLHKLDSSPATYPRNKWRAEIRQFRAEIDLVLTASIRNGMEGELDLLHVKGARLAQADMDDHGDEVQVKDDVRWTLAGLLGESDDPLDGLH